jgi:hypothetical protein
LIGATVISVVALVMSSLPLDDKFLG